MQGEEAVQYCFLQKSTYHFKATAMFNMSPSLFPLLLFSDVLENFFRNVGQCIFSPRFVRWEGHLYYVMQGYKILIAIRAMMTGSTLRTHLLIVLHM